MPKLLLKYFVTLKIDKKIAITNPKIITTLSSETELFLESRVQWCSSNVYWKLLHWLTGVNFFDHPPFQNSGEFW